MTKTLLTVLALVPVGLASVVHAQTPPPPPTVEYYHLDAIGSVRAVTNETGQVVRQHHYFPFGEEYLAQGGNDPLRFASKERDAETGLDYFGARYYGSRRGQFTTVDPLQTLEDNVVDPQRWNRYAYARNNPTRFVDPDGRAVETIADIGFVLYDIFDIARSLVRGEGVSGSQVGALGADLLGAVIPFATGGGIAVRAAAKVDNVKSLKNAGSKAGTEIVERAMSRAELEATQATGLVRGGREGTHYVSDAVNSSAQRARQRLALGETPEVRVTLEVPSGSFSRPSKVAPADGMPGGGTQRTATGPVPAKVVRVNEFKR